MREKTKVIYIPGGVELLVDVVAADHATLIDLETQEEIVVTEDEYCFYAPAQ